MVPIEPWRNSTPVFGAAALCTTKIERFRARAFDHLVLFRFDDSPLNQNREKLKNIYIFKIVAPQMILAKTVPIS